MSSLWFSGFCCSCCVGFSGEHFYYLFAVKFFVERSFVVATAVDVVKGEIIAFV